MGIAKITRNNQITLTGDVIEITGLNEGDILIEQVNEDGEIILKKRTEKKIDSLFGILKGELKGVRKEIEATRSAW